MPGVVIPAPIEGLDTETNMAIMPPTRAIVMRNFFPSERGLMLRRGYVRHTSAALSGPVETLVPYTTPAGVEKLLACSDDGTDSHIYDVTAATPVELAEISGNPQGRYQTAGFSTTGGTFLFFVNGESAPQQYNGTAVTAWAPTLPTGGTLNNLIWISSHHNRLWFGEKDSLVAYYLNAGFITGDATAGTPTLFSYNFGSLAQNGGSLVGMEPWTRDTGEGPDDFAVFLTSEGEVFIFSGTNPNVAASWNFAGRFKVGKPLGRRPFVDWHGDLNILTVDGLRSIEALYTRRPTNLTDNIRTPFRQAVEGNQNLFGWEGINFPALNQMFVNAPLPSGQAEQYVWNRETGAIGGPFDHPALTWAEYQAKPYFGANDGHIYQADRGDDDNGGAYQGEVFTGFSGGQEPQRVKIFSELETTFIGQLAGISAADVHVDYDKTPFVAFEEPPATASQVAVFGTGRWGSVVWGGADGVHRSTRSVAGSGKVAAVHMRARNSPGIQEWLSSEIYYTPSLRS